MTNLRVQRHPVLGDLPEAAPVRITIDGRKIPAREGETIAAALLASGIHVCRTMSNTGERRGPFCAVGRCPDCSMVVDGRPNVRTCQTPVRAGMRVETQRGLGRWESSDA